MFKSITSKPLWVNILFAFGGLAVVLILFMFSLNLVTRHGKTMTIPGVEGRTFAEAKRILETAGFDVEIQDSIYNDTAVAMAVLRQFPAADEVVKVNRTVYLTINRSVPPTIEMPLLEGLSFRNAQLMLKQYGLRMGDTLYRSDYAKNSVLEQQMGGARIKPGTKISMGTKIDLILGSGAGADQFSVPELVGLTYTEAKFVLESNGLVLGTVVADGVSDSASAYVIKQNPERFTMDNRINKMRQGQSVDLFLSIERPVIAPPVIPDTTIKN